MSALLLKLKIWRVEVGLRHLLRGKGAKPRVWSFGAYYIDPKHMVFVVGVDTDAQRDQLRKDKSFSAAMQGLLAKVSWPEPSRSSVIFDVESQETVDRENKGNWWYHYK